MRTSAAGNRAKTGPPSRPQRRPSQPLAGRSSRSAWVPEHGFTLVELLVVMAIMAIGSAGVVFALRDSAATQLEREALRLSALLDSARAQSRATGQGVRWRPVEGGFRFEGLGAGTLPDRWLSGETQVQGTPVLVLGPEPILPPQAVVLTSTLAPGRPMAVSTDGIRPFRVGTPP